MQMQSIYQNANILGLAAVALIPPAISSNVSDSGSAQHVELSPARGWPASNASSTMFVSEPLGSLRTSLSQQFAELRKLRDGWDGNGSLAPDPNVLARAATVLVSVLEAREHLASPQIVPVGDGGVQAEWHLSRQRFEMYFYPDGECVAWLQNRVTLIEKEAVGLEAILLLIRWASAADEHLAF